jgi:hypothetical protein
VPLFMSTMQAKNLASISEIDPSLENMSIQVAR